MDNLEANTPYDDVYRTMYVECDELVLPLINEIFHENYEGNERIIRRGNEHFEHQQGGAEDKKITDSFLEVVSKERKKYHMECESKADGTILVRMFQYGSQIAVEESRIVDNQLHVEFPNAAVLFLRSRKSTPDQMEIHIHTPDGSLSYGIPTCKVSDYTIDNIFNRKLYFLIPFYIFNMEKELPEIDKDRERLQQLKNLYSDIQRRMDEIVENGGLTAFSWEVIRDLSNKVVYNLAKGQENVKKGIGDIMGGKVLDLEVIKIRNAGVEQGRIEGVEQGRIKERNERIEEMLRKGKTPQEISDFCNYPLEIIQEVQESMLAVK